MTRQPMLAVTVIAILACGPRTPTEEPGPQTSPAEPGPVEEADQEPVVEVEAEPAEEPVSEPDVESGPSEVEGSASQTEVAPMQVKDFDVSTEVEFSPSPEPEKKAAAIEKIGMATAGTTDCYVDLLKKQPELEGKIEITFKINPAGVAKAVKATDSTGSPALQKCAVKSFKGKKYPKKLVAKGGVQVEVTLTLKPYK